MIAFPAGVRVWIADGVTDMRCGINSLALRVRQGLGAQPAWWRTVLLSWPPG